MQETQDRFFDRVYWEPAVKSAEFTGIGTALGTAVVYDSKVHGSWNFIRERTLSRHGTAQDVGEKSWINRYVQERRDWLANHFNLLLRKTVYRMDTFGQLIAADKWDIPTPLRVRGVQIDEEILFGAPTRVSAEEEGDRTLQLQTPLMIGADVEALQQALVIAGFSVRADGVFGPLTDAAVRQFQQQHSLKIDGIVGPATRAALGL
jgi:chitosanase